MDKKHKNNFFSYLKRVIFIISNFMSENSICPNVMIKQKIDDHPFSDIKEKQRVCTMVYQGMVRDIEGKSL